MQPSTQAHSSVTMSTGHHSMGGGSRVPNSHGGDDFENDGMADGRSAGGMQPDNGMPAPLDGDNIPTISSGTSQRVHIHGVANNDTVQSAATGAADGSRAEEPHLNAALEEVADAPVVHQEKAKKKKKKKKKKPVAERAPENAAAHDPEAALLDPDAEDQIRTKELEE